jgi:branched-chain amino acid transport system permease protein
MGQAQVRRVLEVAGPAVAICVLVLVVFPAPPGVWFLGFVLGLLNALVALGMALIYRANRTLNLAQSDLGIVPTTLAVALIVYSGVPYVIGLALGLAAAMVLGVVVEMLIIRRFARAPRLILTVATIGISQLLTICALLLPKLWSKEPTSLTISIASTLTFEIRPIIFRADHLVALVIAPVLMVAVAAFLRYSTYGMAVRAAAERPDRAATLGIPVKRVGTIVWVIATVLAFAGLFLRAGIVGLPLAAPTVGFGALLVALTALMLGRLVDLPAVAVSAIAIGVLERTVDYNNSATPELIYPVLGAIIIVSLLVRRPGQSRAEAEGGGSWQAADEVRPVPRELRRVPEVMAARWGGLLLVAVLAYALPQWLGPGDVFKATAVVVFAIIGVSIVVLTGWAGQVSLGQMAFVAVGATLGAYVTVTWNWDLALALAVSAVAGAVAAVIVGLPALRLHGLFLAVTTLAFAVAANQWLLNRKYFSWIPRGRFERSELLGRIELSDPTSMYFTCIGVLVVVMLATRQIRHSRTGRVLLALRENERAAQSYGVNLTRAKLGGFALSGAVAAVAGCLYVQLLQQYSEATYGPSDSLAVFTAGVVGGLGSLIGAVFGALFLRGGTWFLSGPWAYLPTAIGVLLVLLVAPGGLGGLAYRVRDLWLRSVARRFGIVSPSLLADQRVDDGALAGAAEHQPASADPDDAAGAASVHPATSTLSGHTDPIEAEAGR